MDDHSELLDSYCHLDGAAMRRAYDTIERLSARAKALESEKANFHMRGVHLTC